MNNKLRRPIAPPKPKPSTLLSVSELFRKLGVTESTLNRLEEEKKLSGVTVGKDKYFDCNLVLAHLATKRDRAVHVRLPAPPPKRGSRGAR